MKLKGRGESEGEEGNLGGSFSEHFFGGEGHEGLLREELGLGKKGRKRRRGKTLDKSMRVFLTGSVKVPVHTRYSTGERIPGHKKRRKKNLFDYYQMISYDGDRGE